MKFLLTLLFLFAAESAMSQNIIGLWQAETTVIASNYMQHYIFSPGNKFTYNPSGFDGLQRVLAIGGHYKLAGDTLYLAPEYTIESRGGTVERSRTTTLNDSWEIYGGQTKKYLISKPTRQAVYFKLVKRKAGACMLLDMAPYYRIKITTTK